MTRGFSAVPGFSIGAAVAAGACENAGLLYGRQQAGIGEASGAGW
jgi:hypothetical protein